jgi:hypothetical protein
MFQFSQSFEKQLHSSEVQLSSIIKCINAFRRQIIDIKGTFGKEITRNKVEIWKLGYRKKSFERETDRISRINASITESRKFPHFEEEFDENQYDEKFLFFSLRSFSSQLKQNFPTPQLNIKNLKSQVEAMISESKSLASILKYQSQNMMHNIKYSNQKSLDPPPQTFSFPYCISEFSTTNQKKIVKWTNFVNN